jgi:hypothetical protein
MPSLKKTNLRQHIKAVLRFHQQQLLILCFSFGSYFTYLFSHMLELKPSGLYAGHVHVWGDWSLHLAMASIFAYKEPAHWFTNHPYFGGGKLTYGFLTNMISGLLMRAGWSIPAAFLLPSILYCFLLLIGMYFVYYQILKSKNLSLTAISLFFLSSGPGFINLFKTWWKHPTLDFLLFPPKDFSRIEQPYQWLAGNFVNGMMVPQRAFLLGMTIAIWSLAILLYVLRHPSTTLINRRINMWLLLVAGLLAGILPIVHMHSLMALIIISGLVCVAEYRRWRELSIFVILAGLLSSILYLKFVAGGIENPNFMQLLIGWTAPKTIMGWLTMWWRIWGVFTPLSIWGLWFIRKKSLTVKLFFLSFWVIFMLANVIVFQPIQWDNSKMFMWTYFGWSGLVAITLHQLIQRGWPVKILAIILYLTVSLTGCFELMRLTRFDRNSVLITPTTEMQMGKFLREYTDEEAMFLTNASHNHPVSLWGARPILLGYPAWAWNFGFFYEDRLRDMKIMYSGNSQSFPLLKKYHIDFVVIGSGEMADMQANEEFFRARFVAIYADQNYRIYDVRELKNN